MYGTQFYFFELTEDGLTGDLLNAITDFLGTRKERVTLKGYNFS